MTKKRWQKRLVLLVSVLMIITLVACSPAQEPEAPANGSEQQPAEQVAADNYPSRNVEFVIPFSAGGAADVGARTIAPYLGETLGVNVLPENREGAGTQLALTFIHESPTAAEGYAIIFATQPHTSNTILGQGAEYDLDDFVWLNFQMIDPLAINVLPDAQWDDFAEMIEYMENNPGQVSIGVPQMGGSHIFLEYLKQKMNLDFVIVPYDGGGDTRAALIGGHVDAAFTNAQSSESIKDQSKSLGIGWDERSPIWPDTPSFAELFDDEDMVETIMGLASMRGVAVSRKFVDNYPERYALLLEKYEEAFNNEAHLADMETNGTRTVSQFIGPDDSQRLARSTHKTLSEYMHLFE